MVKNALILSHFRSIQSSVTHSLYSISDSNFILFYTILYSKHNFGLFFISLFPPLDVAPPIGRVPYPLLAYLSLLVPSQSDHFVYPLGVWVEPDSYIAAGIQGRCNPWQASGPSRLIGHLSCLALLWFFLSSKGTFFVIPWSS